MLSHAFVPYVRRERRQSGSHVHKAHSHGVYELVEIGKLTALALEVSAADFRSSQDQMPRTACGLSALAPPSETYPYPELSVCLSDSAWR